MALSHNSNIQSGQNFHPVLAEAFHAISCLTLFSFAHFTHRDFSTRIFSIVSTVLRACLYWKCTSYHHLDFNASGIMPHICFFLFLIHCTWVIAIERVTQKINNSTPTFIILIQRELAN